MNHVSPDAPTIYDLPIVVMGGGPNPERLPSTDKIDLAQIQAARVVEELRRAWLAARSLKAADRLADPRRAASRLILAIHEAHQQRGLPLPLPLARAIFAVQCCGESPLARCQDRAMRALIYAVEEVPGLLDIQAIKDAYDGVLSALVESLLS